MKKKALLSVLLVLTLTIGSACSSQADKNARDDGISMVIGGGPKTEDSWAERQLEKIMTDKIGKEVKLNLVFLPSQDPKSKLNLLMSEEDTMPDILTFYDMEDEYRNWEKAGVLEDLTPYLQKHGKSVLNYFPKEAMFYYWNQEGKLYRFQQGIAEPGMKTTILRKDWLDHLGLEVPETLDEYIEVLRAFTHDDPDGNGKNDTYGFSGQNFWDAVYPFLGAYGVQVDGFLKQEDGSIKFGATMPEMKKVLGILQELYKEGVIDPRMPTNDSFSTTDQIFAAGKVGSMYMYNAYLNPSISPYQSFKKQNPDGEYIAIPPIKGPDGFASDYPTPVSPATFVAFTKVNQDPDVSMQLLNEMNTPKTYQLISFGVEGKDYKITEDGVMKSLNTPSQKDERGIGTYWPMSRKDEANIENSPEVRKLFEEREKTSQPMRDKIVELKSLDRPQWKQYHAQLEKLRDQTFWAIVTGKKEVSAFDDFVKTFYKSGGKQVEDEANQFYKKQKKERKAFDQWYKENIEPYK